MTILCPSCGAVLAEKCPQCRRKAEIKGRLSDCLEWDRVLAGAPARMLAGPGVNGQTAVVCWCGKCRRYFEQGQGGASAKVVCEKCGPVQMEMLKVER